MVYLSGPEANLNVRGTVPFPGPYVFVVHFFQPTYPGKISLAGPKCYNLNIIKKINIFISEFKTQVLVQNGLFYEAELPVVHCPGNAGCRSLVAQPDGNSRFPLIENFVLSFKVFYRVKSPARLKRPENFYEAAKF